MVEVKLVFGDAIENFFIKKFAINGTIEDETSISDDYYNLMSAKFLINEYERTTAYMDRLKKFNDVRWDVLTQTERIQNKIQIIEEKILQACKLIKEDDDVDEEIPGNVKEQIEFILENINVYEGKR